MYYIQCLHLHYIMVYQFNCVQRWKVQKITRTPLRKHNLSCRIRILAYTHSEICRFPGSGVVSKAHPTRLNYLEERVPVFQQIFSTDPDVVTTLTGRTNTGFSVHVDTLRDLKTSTASSFSG